MLNTANDLAHYAIELGRMQELIAAPDTDPYVQTRKLIAFYLESAATKARFMAESIAAKEGPLVEGPPKK